MDVTRKRYIFEIIAQGPGLNEAKRMKMPDTLYCRGQGRKGRFEGIDSEFTLGSAWFKVG